MHIPLSYEISKEQVTALTNPVDVFPRPIPGINCSSTAAEKHRVTEYPAHADCLETALRVAEVNARRA